MSKTSRLKPAAVHIAYLVLLFVTMAATLHLGAPSADAAQVTLSWSAPSTNTDGTALSDLAGYKLHIGNASRSYQQSIDVGKLTSYTDSSLTEGSTYYFAVSAYNSSGVHSAYSNELSKSFPILSRTITATAASGGTVTALNNSKVSVASNGTTTISTVTVSSGASQAFSIAPAAGYGIADVKVDGISVGPVASYSFSNVTADHTISATFAVKSFSITASAGTGGTISPSGTTAVNSGGSQTYTITPSTGYKIVGLTVDGASLGALTSYTFSNVTANHTIAASFAVATTTTMTSSAVWQNKSIASQSGTCTVSFEMIPNANNVDAVTVLSAVPAKGYTDGATAVRFNSAGTIDVRNGSTYSARVAMPYVAGSVYRVRMLINVATRRYDVYVTAPGGVETLLASTYAFRTEQATQSVLNNLGIFAAVGSHQLRNLSVVAP